MPDFASLSERLLRGGVAPKYVRRTVTELRDHFSDVKDEALASGLSHDEAEREASSRLGTEDVIVDDILAKPELQCWAARWPMPDSSVTQCAGVSVLSSITTKYVYWGILKPGGRGPPGFF